jgi:hypothetical protein
LIGRIQRWNAERGYGWLGLGKGLPHFMFLRSGLQTPVAEGDTVDCWLIDNPDGKGGLVAAEIAVRPSESSPEVSAALFLGKLPYEVDARELADLLATVGPVAEVGKRISNSFAFVTMVNVEDARALLAGEKHLSLRGRRLRFKVQR